MKDEKLNKTIRIKKQGEISSLFKIGKRWKCNAFSILYIDNDNGYDRMAVIVSKRNGNAVNRNLIKRRYREIFRKTINDTPPFYDILICPRNSSFIDNNILIEKYERWRKK